MKIEPETAENAHAETERTSPVFRGRMEDYESPLFEPLPEEELRRRLSILRPCFFFTPSGSTQRTLVRARAPDDPAHTAYMWSPEPEEVLGVCSSMGAVLSLVGGSNSVPVARLAGLRAVTKHRFAYHGFFKPDLVEAASQLPERLFRDFDEVYVLTDLLHPDISVCCPTQEYHLGLTYYWVPCASNVACVFKREPADLARCLIPETDPRALERAAEILAEARACWEAARST